MSAEPTTLRPTNPPPPGPPRPGAAPVLRWTVRTHLRTWLGWGVVLAAVSALYISFWPAMGDNQEMQALVDGMPEALVTAMGYDAIGSPTGYLESTVYALLAPILLVVFAVGLGAQLIAGDEEAGLLELESAGAVSRWRLLAETALALVLVTAALAAVVGLVSIAVANLVGMDVRTGAVAGATVGLWLLVLALGSISFAVGAATGRRGLAVAVGAGVGVGAYVANALAPLLEDGDWVARLSPFHWYLGNDPLNEGLGLPGAAALLALALGSVLLAAVVYDRRDLGV